ncbi:MAG: hypothetical protein ACRC0L_08430 [Angustibacter sp.]
MSKVPAIGGSTAGGAVKSAARVAAPQAVAAPGSSVITFSEPELMNVPISTQYGDRGIHFGSPLGSQLPFVVGDEGTPTTPVLVGFGVGGGLAGEWAGGFVGGWVGRQGWF